MLGLDAWADGGLVVEMARRVGRVGWDDIAMLLGDLLLADWDSLGRRRHQLVPSVLGDLCLRCVVLLILPVGDRRYGFHEGDADDIVHGIHAGDVPLGTYFGGD